MGQRHERTTAPRRSQTKSWQRLYTDPYRTAAYETYSDPVCNSALTTMDECQLENTETSEGIFGTFGGIADALRAIANAESWSLQGLFLQTSSVFTEENQKPLDSPSEGYGQDKDKRHTDHTQQEMLQEDAFEVELKSKYINSSVPLYQEYWLKCLKTDLQKVKPKILAEPVPSQPLAGMSSPSPLSPAPVPSPTGMHVRPYALWQEMPEVKRQNLADMLTAKDIRLQEAMFELIVSEASYQKSLLVAVGLFQCSSELKRTVSPVQNHVLFSNLKEVCRVSEGFLLDLETRFGQNVVMSKVGDVVLKHRSAFRQVYVPYVTNMMYQEALVAKLLQENKKFAMTLKKLEKDPLCQRQTLKSFLVLPFQRITRLRLILENILKRTDDPTDASDLQEAIEAVREIVVKCDCNVQQMKRTEELVCLEKLLDFGNVKSIPLIASGRHLIRAGPLKKLTIKSNSTVSRTDIYLHLFNDLLLFSVKSGHRFSVQDHAVFPAHVRVEELKTRMLGLPPDVFFLHLAHNHSRAATAFLLAAQTRLEKETWVQLLSSQKGTGV
ncbi:rho guanine nucleotide exchange factor 19 isoform X2 [Brachyhypopomus gauderio]|uniref:rho guanine nucleotide exchange factor 19 isoform X2 n=1 Tax=Brachyhypopomus gauderio TaxID=698409 RepID=UPI0040432BDF